MPNPKSVDFREAALAAYDHGDGTMAEVAYLFNTFVSSIVRWNALRHAARRPRPLPHSGGRTHQKIFDEHRQAMAAWLQDEPEQTLPELAARILKEYSITIDPSTLSQHLKHMRLPLKKYIRRYPPAARRRSRPALGLQRAHDRAAGQPQQTNDLGR